MPRFLLCLALLAGCGENQTPLPDRPSYTAADGGILECVPNLDGRIDADEMEVFFDGDALTRLELEELDDVQRIYSNADFSDEVLENYRDE